jgi:multidrug efflux pump subunit AcrA (membrane-fusion protein)
MRTIIQYGLIGAVASVFIGCKSKPAETTPPVPVQVAPAIRGSIRNIVTADAILYPRDQANIMPKISAPVRRFLVQRGDRVKRGQLLAELENRDLVAAAVASRGQYAQAESNYRTTSGAAVPEQMVKAQTDLAASREAMGAAKKVLDSREEIFKEGAIARKQVDEAQVAYTQARGQFETAQEHLNDLQRISREEQIKAAAGQVEAAKGQYDSARAQVAFSEIRSPINGVVTDRPLYAGEMANPGSPVVTVMDVSSVVARISMAQDLAKDIKAGDEATLTPNDGSEPVPAKVTIVSPAVDPNSTTVQVWVQATNPEGRLRAGTSVRAAIVAATIDGAIVVPSSAILASDEGGSMVVVVDDKDVAHQKKIQVGVQEENLTQVIAGLTPGDRVVTVGGLGLDDKARVRVLKPGEKRPGEVEEKDEEDKGDDK